jgi:TonB family protein
MGLGVIGYDYIVHRSPARVLGERSVILMKTLPSTYVRIWLPLSLVAHLLVVPLLARLPLSGAPPAESPIVPLTLLDDSLLPPIEEPVAPPLPRTASPRRHRTPAVAPAPTLTRKPSPVETPAPSAPAPTPERPLRASHHEATTAQQSDAAPIARQLNPVAPGGLPVRGTGAMPMVPGLAAGTPAPARQVEQVVAGRGLGGGLPTRLSAPRSGDEVGGGGVAGLGLTAALTPPAFSTTPTRGGEGGGGAAAATAHQARGAGSPGGEGIHIVGDGGGGGRERWSAAPGEASRSSGWAIGMGKRAPAPGNDGADGSGRLVAAHPAATGGQRAGAPGGGGGVGRVGTGAVPGPPAARPGGAGSGIGGLPGHGGGQGPARAATAEREAPGTGGGWGGGHLARAGGPGHHDQAGDAGTLSGVRGGVGVLTPGSAGAGGVGRPGLPTAASPGPLHTISGVGLLPGPGSGRGAGAGRDSQPERADGFLGGGSLLGPGVGPALPSYGAKAQEGPTPSYPSMAMAESQYGTVVIAVTVTPDGTAGKVDLTQRSRSDMLDNAAIRAARRWIFSPAYERGRPVASVVKLKFVFSKEGTVEVTPL